jgi:uncharacterized tellurite resistance protein B-like protein
MINRIKAFLAGEADTASTTTKIDDPLQLAAAALMVEAACMDGHFDDDERATIERILCGHFALTTEEAGDLIVAAEEAVNATWQLYAFTKVVKDRFSNEERVRMIEMIWEVAYADGRLDHFESNLIRRVGGLLYVSDRDRGAARKRVMARLGIDESSV